MNLDDHHLSFPFQSAQMMKECSFRWLVKWLVDIRWMGALIESAVINWISTTWFHPHRIVISFSLSFSRQVASERLHHYFLFFSFLFFSSFITRNLINQFKIKDLNKNIFFLVGGASVFQWIVTECWELILKEWMGEGEGNRKWNLVYPMTTTLRTLKSERTMKSEKRERLRLIRPPTK